VEVETVEPQAGRILRSESGGEVQVALDADGARAVDAILDVLERGG
jgi:hypothetical protein